MSVMKLLFNLASEIIDFNSAPKYFVLIQRSN